jgi:hypothetical protein
MQKAEGTKRVEFNEKLAKTAAGSIAEFVQALVDKTHRGKDFTQHFAAARSVADHVGKLVGDTVADFMKLDKSVRDKLRKAAGFVARSYRADGALFAFLKSVIEPLKRLPNLVRETCEGLTFLLKLGSHEDAHKLRPALLAY